MSFEKLGLEKSLLKALADQGYTEPTPIQQSTIVPVLEGKDVMATAQTGTGKTAAFTLPLLQLLQQASGDRSKPRALIVTPTRELAAQVLASINTYGKYLPLKAMAVYGGVKIGPQIKSLRQGVDIVVATPGRLLDLYQQKAINFKSIQMLILDEADRMLDMGFIPDIRRIQSRLPEDKQTLMFSATFSRDIRDLAKTMLAQPVQVDVAAQNATAETVEQSVVPVDKEKKAEALKRLFETRGCAQTLVFTRTKHGANKLVKVLNKSGIQSEAIHGNKSQGHRTRVLEGFKRGKVSVLVATDIASRGLDINELPLVVNYELPHVPEDYVHRIGRTGRAGKEGLAVSLVSADEAKQLHAIEKLTEKDIARDVLEDFEPSVPVPLRKQSRNQRSGNRSNVEQKRNGRSKKPSGKRFRGRRAA
ncbi:MAG: DEAD/DEAH box helicase [Gammaproteobacteria bacterium]|nr:DEAD/DEAH box helicase [Gammaproteobacteria bacterium]MBT4491665.1 DEAD/DEAH box helicase [Gammaproteobacteria bacterium]